MTTHGRTGWSRAWVGRVADAVVRTVSAPVLLVRPLEAAGPVSPGRFARVLIPLDGSTEAEEILTHAVEIGGDARFLLLRMERPVIVPRRPYTYAAPAWAMDQGATDEAVAHARDYLNGVAHTLRARRPAAVVDVDVRVAEQIGTGIVDSARDYEADLIALTTHAHRGVRLVLGSVADKVLRGAHGSVLVLRPSTVTIRDQSAPDVAGAISARH